MQERDVDVIQSQRIENRGVEIEHVGPLVDRAQTDLVRCADGLAALDAASRHPHRKSPGIVIASLALFVERRAAEFAAPDHQRFLEKAAGFEIGRAIRRSACPRFGTSWSDCLRDRCAHPNRCRCRNTARRSGLRAPPAGARADSWCRTSRFPPGPSRRAFWWLPIPCSDRRLRAPPTACDTRVRTN